MPIRVPRRTWGVLERRLVTATGEHRSAVLDQLASLYDGPLADPVKYLSVVRQFGQHEPENLHVLRRLASALARNGEYHELERLYLELESRESDDSLATARKPPSRSASTNPRCGENCSNTRPKTGLASNFNLQPCDCKLQLTPSPSPILTL